MPSPFVDHPRKRIVREIWDTPILEWLFRRWGAKYLYLGLPGPEAHDIKLWASMVGEVIAFETTDDSRDNPRENLERINSTLTLLNLPYTVYHGNIEDVVLWKEDLDGIEFKYNKFVTLFNLDFCNAITGKVDAKDGRRCLRFESIRELITLQRSLYRTTGVSKFVILITVLDAFHTPEIVRFTGKSSLSNAMRTAVANILGEKRLLDRPIQHNTNLLRLFILDFLSNCLVGQNVRSFFLPLIKYEGRSRSMCDLPNGEYRICKCGR